MYRISLVSCAVFATAAAAQQEPRPDPADPSARVPKPEYRSAFSGYRPYREEEPARWREANDEVRRLGGHTGHAKHSGKPTGKSPEDGKK